MYILHTIKSGFLEIEKIQVAFECKPKSIIFDELKVKSVD